MKKTIILTSLLFSLILVGFGCNKKENCEDNEECFNQAIANCTIGTTFKATVQAKTNDSKVTIRKEIFSKENELCKIQSSVVTYMDKKETGGIVNSYFKLGESKEPVKMEELSK